MPLRKDDIERFKKELLERRAHYAQIMHNAQENKGYSPRQGDECTGGVDFGVNLQLTDGEYKIICQIDRALEKIEENTYGICDVTGEEIPISRLESIPYATMTVKAQDMAEKGFLP